TTSTSGQSQDPDGYTFAVDNGTPQQIGVNQTITVTPVATGSHTVVLAGVAGNCTVANGPSRTVTVPEGGSVEAAFSVTCTQLTGSVTVTTSTSGDTPDPDGYTVAVTGAASRHIDPNGTVTFANLATGDHTVTLSGIASNCSVSGGPSRPVTVSTGQTVIVTFTIDCPTAPPPNQPPTAAFPAPNCSGLTCSFTDQSSDPDGSIATRDWDFGDGSNHSAQANPTHTYAAGGTYTVRLTVTDNQGASNDVTHGVTVQAPPPPNQ